MVPWSCIVGLGETVNCFGHKSWRGYVRLRPQIGGERPSVGQIVISDNWLMSSGQLFDGEYDQFTHVR